jgi:hypothetical protein
VLFQVDQNCDLAPLAIRYELDSGHWFILHARIVPSLKGSVVFSSAFPALTCGLVNAVASRLKPKPFCFPLTRYERII